MRTLIRAAVVASILGVTGAELAHAANLVTQLGQYSFRPGRPFIIKWTGGPSGNVYITIDRKVGSSSWTQPFRWFEKTGSMLTTTTIEPLAANFPNTGLLVGNVPFALPPFPQCGPNYKYRIVVFEPDHSYGYGPTFTIPC